MTTVNNTQETFDQYVAPTWKSQLAYFGRLLWRDKGGLIGLTIFVLLVVTAVFAQLCTALHQKQGLYQQLLTVLHQLSTGYSQKLIGDDGDVAGTRNGRDCLLPARKRIAGAS